MKKFFALLLSVLLSLSLLTFSACSNVDNGNTLTFYAPDGAPALAIAKFINDGEDFDTGKEMYYNVVSSNDIGGVMSQGKGDFIVMPVTAASKLYKAKASSPYVMAAVITHGNLYLMSSKKITNLENLKGEVVGVIGQGAVPDLTLRAILSAKNLLDDVVVGDSKTEGKITLRYFSEASNMLPLLAQGDLSIGLLPEPAATNLTKGVENDTTWTRVDVQELYSDTKSYPQAVLMIKKSVYDKYKENFNKMEDLFDENVAWINYNVKAAVDAVKGVLSAGLTPSLTAANIDSTVVENCKIYYESAAQAKESVKNYIEKIRTIDSASASAVSDDFFA